VSFLIKYGGRLSGVTAVRLCRNGLSAGIKFLRLEMLE
jgi:hypothetical protein